MKKVSAVCLFLFLSLSQLLALLPISTNTNTIIADIAEISKLFPRTEGSPQEAALLEYITESLEKEGFNYTEKDFQDASGYHSFSKILSVDIPGKNPDTLVLALSLDSNRTLENESGRTGALNIALALAFLREMHHSNPPINIRVLFLGAQEGTGGEYPLGSRHYLADFFPEDPVSFLYLDFPDSPGEVNIEIGGRGVLTPRWLIEKTTGSLNKTSLAYSVASQKAIFFRLGYGDPNGVIDDFLSQGYPAILFNSANSTVPMPEAELRRWIQSFFFFLSDFVTSNGDGFSQENETNYQFIRWGKNTYIVPESVYISLIIAIPVLLLFYPFFARRRFQRYVRLMGRHVWIIPLTVVLVLFYLLLGTFFIELILQIKSAPDFWESRPLVFFFLKIAGALTLYWITHRFFKLFPFSKKGNFYSASALILLIVAFFLVAGIIVSLAHLMLWSLFFAFLFTIFRNRYVKAFCLLLSMSWLVIFGFSILTQPQLNLSEFILFSRWKGNGFMALIMVPYVFMFIRLSFLFSTHNKQLRRRISRTILAVLLTSSLSLNIYLLLIPPYNTGDIQPLSVTDVIVPDQDERIIQVTSPAPFGTESLLYDGNRLPLPPRQRNAEIALAAGPPPPVYSMENSFFLDQQEWDIRVDAPEGSPPPETIRLYLNPEPQEVLVILDSNFPYSTDRRTGQVLFHVGISPPQPLRLNFVLPQKTSVSGLLEIEESRAAQILPPQAHDPSKNGQDYAVESRRVFRYSLFFPGGGENVLTEDGPL